MSSTMMDEVRRKRGLAYGAYLTLEERRATGGAVGWVFSGTDKTVPMVKLVLKLYVSFMEKGLDAQQVAFFQRFLAGSHAAELDAPDRRLEARVTNEIAGLPPDFLDTFGARVAAATPDAVNAAIKRHIHARDLAITMVATARVHEEAADRRARSRRARSTSSLTTATECPRPAGVLPCPA